ncbi:Cyclin-like F-box [Drechmeria coniospora]|uniref:Cyclin-like F-box n=1 Tax=Drechmeria coniospora TaxID=98403 RepID=A0A151GHC2_DRECN|nr:Cyclin-like F-box [Drechmeria coniospora]KYK56494.1 Cyclin-like F-box [Drechmeria coniospora]
MDDDLPPPSYRSATEYPIQEEQTSAIIRTASYHREDFCRSVIWFSPREHVGIRSSMAESFQRTAEAGLGSLNRLPLELLHDVLLRLDTQSLFNFRQTNLRSRQVLHSMKQYRIVISHGLNLLCALLRTRLAVTVSLFDFYYALCTKLCTTCGEFGGFMSLLAWNRCCFVCLQNAPECQVKTLASVRKQFNMTKAEAVRLESFKTLPGIYSMEESAYRSRVTVVSAHQAAISSRQQRLHASAQVPPANGGRNQKLNFMASCALPYYDGRTGKVEHGISCAGCQLAFEKGITHSRGERWAVMARDKVYARDDYLGHFRWCEQAQLLWRTSADGKREPPELPELARRGGYFSMIGECCH